MPKNKNKQKKRKATPASQGTSTVRQQDSATGTKSGPLVPHHPAKRAKGEATGFSRGEGFGSKRKRGLSAEGALQSGQAGKGIPGEGSLQLGQSGRSGQSGIPGEGTSGQGNPIGQSLRDVATGTGAAAQVAENDSKKGRRRKGKAGAAGKIVGGDASKSASGGSGADAAKSAGGDVGASAASNARSSSSFLRVGNGGGGSSSKKLSLLDKMKARLAGSRFRSLNEALYTSDGDKAFQMFSQDPSAFTQYHEGYREQVASWPINPLHVIIDWIRQRPATLTVADFGCGEAKLAASVPNKVVSLDLVAAAPGVIACNMAHTPLQDSSVHIAVFCLSLMGADYPSFLSEAHRVLQPGGSLIIAEVRSRFDPTTGGAELKDFVAALKQLGFRLVSKDLSNKMFLLLFLEKVQSELKKGQVKKNISVSADITWPALKPCLYKRR